MADINTIQTYTLPSSGSGSYTLTIEGQTTAAISYGAAIATVRAAVEALSSVGSGNVSVSLVGLTYRLEFIGALANRAVGLLTVGVGSLLVPASTINVNVQTEGNGFVAEVQRITLADNPTAGTWKPNPAGSAVNFDADESTVLAALAGVTTPPHSVSVVSPGVWDCTWQVSDGNVAFVLAPVNVDLRRVADAITAVMVQAGYWVESVSEIAVLRLRATRASQTIFTNDARRSIAVDQPQGGDLYPFLAAGDLYRYVADFYLSYVDQQCAFEAPFRIGWAYGLGVNTVTPPSGWPEPTHAYDLVILDANDRRVFDSTAATTFYTRGWADRLLIVEWRNSEAVCRIVLHQAWPPGETPVELDDYLTPTGAELDPRTYERLPERLTHVTVGEHTINAEELLFDNGYNSEFTVVDAVDNLFADTEITVDLSSGAGDGVHPCEATESTLTINKLNGVAPDSHGNVMLSPESCYRLERPQSRVLDGPPPVADVTDHTLKLSDDCVPCCDCEDFARTYEGISRVWARWADIASSAIAARTQLVDTIYTAWTDRASCYAGRALRIAVMPSCPCSLAFVIMFCNNTECDITNAYIRFRLTDMEDNPYLPDSGDIRIEERCGRTYLFVKNGTNMNVYEPATLSVSGTGWHTPDSSGTVPPGGNLKLSGSFMFCSVDNIVDLAACYDFANPEDADPPGRTVKLWAQIIGTGLPAPIVGSVDVRIFGPNSELVCCP